MKTVCKDHLGNEFGSLVEMCTHWHIDYDTIYLRRKRRGWELKDILETPVKHKLPVEFAGVKYDTFSDMCLAFGLSSATVRNRLNSGWDLGSALTLPVSYTSYGKPCKDHLGNEYDTITEMTTAYGITYSAFSGRLRRGATIEEALTRPLGRNR